jgi:hypothetical protein
VTIDPTLKPDWPDVNSKVTTRPPLLHAGGQNHVLQIDDKEDASTVSSGNLFEPPQERERAENPNIADA